MKSKIHWAVVDRPGDVGMDLPPGVTARELTPADYHPIDMETPEESPAKRGHKTHRGTTGRKTAAR